MDLATFLETSATFADFTQPEIDVLNRSLRLDQCRQDFVFFHEGDKGNRMYILVQGQVQMSRRRTRSRGYQYRNLLQPGDIFGLQSLLDNQPRFSTCRAVTDVTVASLPRTAFNLLYHSHIGIAEHFQYIVARQLARELRVLDRQLIEALVSGDVDGLLAGA